MKVKTISVLRIPISLVNYQTTLQKIHEFVVAKTKTYICVAATHLLVECQKNRYLNEGVTAADIVTPDGMPLVWIMRRKGGNGASRVYGPELTERVCQIALMKSYRIFLLGGRAGQSKRLKSVLISKFPGIKICGNADTPDKTRIAPNVINDINISLADIVFVGIGCPYQELWMIQNRKALNASVLIGVGAAFDFILGYKKQAPVWMQNNGLEWMFRLIQEPGRLWKRYIVDNTLFIYYCLKFESPNFFGNLHGK